MSDSHTSNPSTTYTNRTEQFAHQRDHFERRSSFNGNLSLLILICALSFLGLALWQRIPNLLFVSCAISVLFIISFINHGRINRQRDRYNLLWQINDEGLRRLRRDWTNLPTRPIDNLGLADRPELREYAADLDVIGHASLMHLLNTTTMPIGQATLARWLLRPAKPQVIDQRQAAVAELTTQIEFRDSFALLGRLLGVVQPSYQAFARWAAGPPWLNHYVWLLWLARIIPIGALLGWLAQLANLTTLPLWAPFVVLGALLSFTVGRLVDQQIDAISERQEVCRTYAELFSLIGQQNFQAPLLHKLQARLTANQRSATDQMRRFARIMVLADIRKWMFFFVVQILTLWNVHVLWLLERWQYDTGAHVADWLAVLGETEALNALATLAHDQPTWCFPTVSEQETQLSARQLGHPLLADSVRVSNDVTIGPAGRFLLVTGSNMSGKSTLLRAIGLNVSLAQAGGPTCADELRMPPIELATSMRMQDSLEQGVSSFMAELQRLKAVVDTAQRVHDEGYATTLFLLDEILHGTNTAERQIAARQVIRHLLRLRAFGAVSTHDLTLADDPALAELSQPVYFTEYFEPGPEGSVMRFDYRLRQGIAPSTNALELVRQILGDAISMD